mmetsp:Transcript_27203/g.61720  ORF Transcript_27203/g.61720 Transcript_27203/m.61720 type:complete len:106 (+) Transcript_27203:97-414(+)
MSWPLMGKENEGARVCIMLDGEEEWVDVDPYRGPVCINADGGPGFLTKHHGGAHVKEVDMGTNTPWVDMSKTEKEVMLHVVAKRNRGIRQNWLDLGRKPQRFFYF